MSEIELRPFQERALSQYRKAWPLADAHLGIAPTAFGKTIFMGWIVKAMVSSAEKFRCVCIAHRENLITQNAEKVGLVAPWLKIGIERAKEAADPDCDFISASIATLRGKRLDDFCKNIRADGRPIFLFIDECFPAGTLVDGHPIESLKVGSKVSCFNHKNGRIEISKVVRVFKSKPKNAMVKLIFSNGSSLVCTPGHPFWDGTSYVEAYKMKGKFSYEISMYSLLSTDRNKDKKQKRFIPKIWPCILQRYLQRLISNKDIFRNCNQDEFKICVEDDEVKKPNAPAGVTRKNEVYSEKDRASSEDKGGQWSRDDSASGDSSEITRVNVGRGTSDIDKGSTRKRLPTLLQSRHRESEAQDRGRGRWWFSSFFREESYRQKERSVFNRVRVESVEVQKPGGDGKFGGLCEDGIVYNIEVENHNNYFAEGVLVHNCHHATADSYQRLIATLKPEKHLGLTATPFRADDACLANTYPETGFNIPRSEMIDDGWLARPRHWLIKSDISLEGIKKIRGDYNEKDLAKRLNVGSRNELILNAAGAAAELIQDEMGTTARAVCFCLSVDHAKVMARLFTKRDWDAKAIWSDTPIDERRAGDEMLRTGSRNSILLNYGVLTEGWDLEEVNLGIFARPTKSPVLADQMLGRVLRFREDKPWSMVLDLGDIDAGDRCSMAGTFKLPTEWDSIGTDLRKEEIWFQKQIKQASYVVRSNLWKCQTRDEVTQILANQPDFEAALIPGRAYMWWDCHTEVRMVISASSIVVWQTDMGEYRAEYRFGPERVDICRAVTIDDCFDQAEEWLRENMPEMEVYLRNYPDRGDPVTDAQVAFLARNGGQEEDIRQLTKRRAGFEISKTFMEISKNAEGGIICFGKHSGTHVSEVSMNYIQFMLDQRMEWLEGAKRPELPWFRLEQERRPV